MKNRVSDQRPCTTARRLRDWLAEDAAAREKLLVYCESLGIVTHSRLSSRVLGEMTTSNTRGRITWEKWEAGLRGMPISALRLILRVCDASEREAEFKA